jgi:hypothetical protein
MRAEGAYRDHVVRGGRRGPEVGRSGHHALTGSRWRFDRAERAADRSDRALRSASWAFGLLTFLGVEPRAAEAAVAHANQATEVLMSHPALVPVALALGGVVAIAGVFIKGGKGAGSPPDFDRVRDRTASQLHDLWRAPRWKESEKVFEPRIKKTKDQEWIRRHGTDEVDIANTSYENLPSDWQGENKVSADVAVGEVFKAVQNGVALDASFIESASAVVHEKWLERNGSWAPPEQKLPYEQLSEAEREKDRAIVREAIKQFEDIANDSGT